MKNKKHILEFIILPILTFFIFIGLFGCYYYRQHFKYFKCSPDDIHQSEKIDYSCKIDSDCAIKDSVGYDVCVECMNKNFEYRPDVSGYSACGYPGPGAKCECFKNQCYIGPLPKCLTDSFFVSSFKFFLFSTKEIICLMINGIFNTSFGSWESNIYYR